MGKPKCEKCQKAMKRPHERVGAKGNWISIKQWWYCNNCNLMNKSENQISKDVEKYIDSILGKKYPKIARIREELNAPYYNIHELETVLQNNENNQIRTTYSKIQDKLIPKWACTVCEINLPMNLDMISGLTNEDEFLEKRPKHCDTLMNIQITSASEKLSHSQKVREDLFTKAIENNLLVEAGEIFLESFLNEFAYQSVKNSMRLFIKTARKEIPNFSESFGYRMVTLIIESFIPHASKSIDEYSPMDLASFKLNPNDETITKLNGIFLDIQLYFVSRSPNLLPGYRRISWMILSLAETWKHNQLQVDIITK